MDPKTPQSESQAPSPKPVQVLADPEKINSNPENTVICKHCQKLAPSTSFFCPNCGKKIQDAPYKFSVMTWAGVILESILLPPLGIIPGIRYLKKEETGAKVLGITAIIITIFMTIFTIMFLKSFIETTNRQLNDVNYMNNIYSNPQGSVENQLQQLQNSQ